MTMRGVPLLFGAFSLMQYAPEMTMPSKQAIWYRTYTGFTIDSANYAMTDETGYTGPDVTAMNLLFGAAEAYHQIWQLFDVGCHNGFEAMLQQLERNCSIVNANVTKKLDDAFFMDIEISAPATVFDAEFTWPDSSLYKLPGDFTEALACTKPEY